MHWHALCHPLHALCSSAHVPSLTLVWLFIEKLAPPLLPAGVFCCQMQLSPLVQSYMDACRAAGHPHSQQIADQLGISESSGTLTLEGAALPDGAATNLAAVLPVCTHLKGDVNAGNMCCS